MSNSKRVVTTFPDGTINVQVVDTRTPEEKLTGKLTFAEKLDLMYPTTDPDPTDWDTFDDHKRCK